jgi:hypothetical protein
MKFYQIRAVKAELFHAERRTDGQDEVNSRFSEFCERAKRWIFKKYDLARTGLA